MHVVAALYHFVPIADPAALRDRLAVNLARAGVRGTLLVASEGLNGTIAGSRAAIDEALATLRALPGCASLEWKESTATAAPFARLKVRLKREIVTMGVPQVDPRAAVGRHVPPAEWNALMSQDDVVVIDTRNDYEVAIGTFTGAIDPGTRRFRDFPAWWQANAARFHNKRIAMFCTGGIRCEKSTSYLVSQGVKEVFHLKGGILKYLEEIRPEESLWNGACFVFDRRVSVTHGLQEGPHVLCHACRRPLLPADCARPEYEEGVSCHQCLAETTPAQRARFRERQRQIALARARGQSHLPG